MKLLCAVIPVLVYGHGNHVYPPAWWDTVFDTGLNLGMYPGMTCAQGCNGTCESFCMWYSNYTMLPSGVNATIERNSTLRTYQDFNFHPLDKRFPDVPLDVYANHPWRHPGKAPVWSSCGISGGNPKGCGLPPGVRCPDGGDASGPDARFYNFTGKVTTKWKQGQVVEAAWGITANHGGGYAYRLCPLWTASQPYGLPLDEPCFQSHHLDFVGDKQWLQFGFNRSTRSMYGDLKAKRTTEGTWPLGSMWTRNPIPACKGPGSARANGRGGGNQTAFPNKGGAISCSAASYKGGPLEGVVEGPQFDPPGGYPGKHAHQGIYTYGFGNNEGDNAGGAFLFTIVDLLQVPKDIEPGWYVLSFRYDCEQTTQVWSSCSDILILPANSTERDGALIPEGPTLWETGSPAANSIPHHQHSDSNFWPSGYSIPDSPASESHQFMI